MIRRLAPFLIALLLGTAAMATMKWPDLFSRAKPAPDAAIPYGPDPLQHVELWLPKGPGPFPVVVMIHGGCWQTEVAKLDIMNWIAGDLRQRGIAVWNVEYRGVDRPGGGYPGTFRDVSVGTDTLTAFASKYHLRTDRVVLLGHSAGGHLALWLAARDRLPARSPLRSHDPLAFRAAISLGGLPDLQAAATPPGDTCGPEAVPMLVGQRGPGRTDVYADTSPAVLPAPAAPVTLVNGDKDPIAPPAFAVAYAKLRPARRIVVPDEGHVELITPGTQAWGETVKAIEAALK